MADDYLLPLSGDEKLILVAGLKRLIDDDHYPLGRPDEYSDPTGINLFAVA